MILQKNNINELFMKIIPNGIHFELFTEVLGINKNIVYCTYNVILLNTSLFLATNTNNRRTGPANDANRRHDDCDVAERRLTFRPHEY